MSDWQLPKNVESIAANTRVCWNCRHCMEWTATPGSWVGRCMERRAADYEQYIWLERDSCGYFCQAERGTG